MRHLYFALIAAIVLFTCTEEESISSRPFPNVTTHAVDEITTSGALLKGEITSAPSEVIDHGFVISSNENFYGVIRISLGAKSDLGKFETRLETDLAENVTYYVKAYAKSPDYTYEGKRTSFVSLGSKAPLIKSISPVLGTWGDTLVVRGENFSKALGNAKVKFGSEFGTVIKTSADSIICLVPSTVKKTPVTVQVSVLANTTELVDAFAFRPPEISGITPDNGEVGTTVAINGKYFNAYVSKVFFNDILVQPKSITKTQILCDVPNGLIGGNTQVRVTNVEGNPPAVADFYLRHPRIIDATPLTGTYGDVVTLTTADWPAGQTIAFVGGLHADIISNSGGAIKIKIPDQLTQPENRIVLQVDGLEIMTDKYFRLNAPVVTSISGITDGQIIITGSNFSLYETTVFIDGQFSNVVSVTSTEIIAQVNWVFHSNEPSVIVTCSGQNSEGTHKLSSAIRLVQSFYFEYENFIGPLASQDGMYVLTHSLWYGAKLHFFNQALNAWESLQNPPFTPSADDFAFSIGKDLYVYDVTDKLFWKYDYYYGQWQEKNAPPFNVMFAYETSIDNIGYVFCGYSDDFSAESKAVWAYDPGADQWTEKTSSPAFFEIGQVFRNKLYSAGPTASNYIYDPVNDSWGNFNDYVPADAITTHDGNYFKYDLASRQLSAFGLLDTFRKDITLPDVGFELRGACTVGSKIYLIGVNQNVWEVNLDLMY